LYPYVGVSMVYPSVLNLDNLIQENTEEKQELIMSTFFLKLVLMGFVSDVWFLNGSCFVRSYLEHYYKLTDFVTYAYSFSVSYKYR